MRQLRQGGLCDEKGLLSGNAHICGPVFDRVRAVRLGCGRRITPRRAERGRYRLAYLATDRDSCCGVEPL